jgi:hypothetical protein
VSALLSPARDFNLRTHAERLSGGRRCPEERRHAVRCENTRNVEISHLAALVYLFTH